MCSQHCFVTSRDFFGIERASVTFAAPEVAGIGRFCRGGIKAPGVLLDQSQNFHYITLFRGIAMRICDPAGLRIVDTLMVPRAPGTVNTHTFSTSLVSVLIMALARSRIAQP